jgi:hypothetical protein
MSRVGNNGHHLWVVPPNCVSPSRVAVTYRCWMRGDDRDVKSLLNKDYIDLFINAYENPRTRSWS